MKPNSDRDSESVSSVRWTIAALRLAGILQRSCRTKRSSEQASGIGFTTTQSSRANRAARHSYCDSDGALDGQHRAAARTGPGNAAHGLCANAKPSVGDAEPSVSGGVPGRPEIPSRWQNRAGPGGPAPDPALSPRRSLRRRGPHIVIPALARLAAALPRSEATDGSADKGSRIRRMCSGRDLRLTAGSHTLHCELGTSFDMPA
jgi:hypothetical protein